MNLPYPFYSLYIIFTYTFFIGASITVTFVLNGVLSSIESPTNMSIIVFGMLVGFVLLAKGMAQHVLEKERLEGERGAISAVAIWIIYSTVYGMTKVFSTNIWFHLAHDIVMLIIIVLKISNNPIFKNATHEKVFRYVLFIVYVLISIIPFQSACIGEIPLWDVAVRIGVSLIAHLACEYWKTIVFNEQTSWTEISWMIFSYPLYSTIYSIFGICIVALIFLLEIETIKEKIKWISSGGFLNRVDSQIYTIEDEDEGFDKLAVEKGSEDSSLEEGDGKQPFNSFELGEEEEENEHASTKPSLPTPPPVSQEMVVSHNPPRKIILSSPSLPVAPAIVVRPIIQAAAPARVPTPPLVTLPQPTFSYNQVEEEINYGHLDHASWTQQLDDNDLDTMSLILEEEQKKRR